MSTGPLTVADMLLPCVVQRRPSRADNAKGQECTEARDDRDEQLDGEIASWTTLARLRRHSRWRTLVPRINKLVAIAAVEGPEGVRRHQEIL